MFISKVEAYNIYSTHVWGYNDQFLQEKVKRNEITDPLDDKPIYRFSVPYNFRSGKRKKCDAICRQRGPRAHAHAAPTRSH
jgi:hypothetical protein